MLVHNRARPSVRATIAVLALLVALPLAAAASPPASSAATAHDFAPVERDAGLLRLGAGVFDPLADPLPTLTGVPVVAEATLDGVEVQAWLVQAADAGRIAEVHAAISARGLGPAGYVHDTAYIVLATPTQRLELLAALGDAVRWSGLVQPAWKLRPSTLAAGDRAQMRALLFHAHPAARTAADRISALPGVEVSDADQRSVSFRATADALGSVAALPEVMFVEPVGERIFHNANARWVNDTGIRRTHHATAPGRLTGAGQTSAVADSGLPYTDGSGPAHAAFRDCRGGTCLEADFVQEEPGTSSDQMTTIRDNRAADGRPPHRKMSAYFDLGDAGAATYDDSGHGTHVAGSVTGDAGTWGTWDAHDGIAPGARHVHQNIATPTGSLGGIPGYIYPLFEQAYRPRDPASLPYPRDPGDADDQADYVDGYVATSDARVHNNSWGILGPVDIYGDAYAMDDFVWNNEDMVIVASAGNSGPEAGSVGGPANAKNNFSSGASMNGDIPMASIHAMAPFSSHGPATDGRFGVDFATPGEVVTSPKSGSDSDDHYLQGTSMSGPVLAGLAVLVREYFWEGWGPADGSGFAPGRRDAARRHNPSAALVKATLAAGTERMRGPHTGDDGSISDLDGQYPSAGQGFGLVNLSNSLYFAGDEQTNWYHDVWRADDEAFGIGIGDVRTYEIEVVGDGPLEVALAWTDAPTPPIVELLPTLVNRLDLALVAPDGTRYAGNLFNTRLSPGADEHETQAFPPGLDELAHDPLNNLEKVRVVDPEPGTWTIQVRGTLVGDGPQGFALAARGPLGGAGAPALGTPLQTAQPGAPSIQSVSVTPVSADLAVVELTTSEATTASIEVGGREFASVMDIGDDGFGFDFPTASPLTSPDTSGVPWETREHRIHVAGLDPATTYRGTITVTDLAGTSTTREVTFTTPAATFQPAAFDIAQLASEATDFLGFVEPAGWGTGAQLYAGRISSLLGVPTTEADLLGAFMFRLPTTIDPDRVVGAVVELTGAHVISTLLVSEEQVEASGPLPEPTLVLDLLDREAEERWGSQNYEQMRSEDAVARLRGTTGNFVGGQAVHRFAVGCEDLGALVSALEDDGDERRLAFRLQNTFTDSDADLVTLPSFEFGFNRRSHGPEHRPSLTLLLDDGSTVEAAPAGAAPTISDVRVQEVGPSPVHAAGDDGVEDARDSRSTSVTVSWRTDVPADATVVVRRPDGELLEVRAAGHGTLHSVEVSGLDADAAAAFAVRSATPGGAIATETNGGAGFGFYADLPATPRFGPLSAPSAGLTGFSVPASESRPPSQAEIEAGTTVCVAPAAAPAEPDAPPTLPATGGGIALLALLGVGLAAVLRRSGQVAA